MKKLLFILCIYSVSCFGQESKLLNPDPSHEWFGMSCWEFIFSGGKVTDTGKSLDNVVRFSGFFNYQQQEHFDFGKHIGLYTGLGIRNTGFINTIKIDNIGDVTLKQRSYSFGIPLALKFGNMEAGKYFALGMEEELMFHYKSKILYSDSKSVFTEWFSPDVNKFNLSFFAELRSHNGTFIRFKYYLDNFLTDKISTLNIPGSTAIINYKPEKSTMFYISIGTAIKIKRKHHATKTEV